MGEAGRDVLRVGFEGTIKLEFHGAKVSSDAGLFPYRDIDEAAQLTESGAAELFDFRSGSNIQHSTIALLRQSVYSRLAGYEDTNDAERLSVDPVMRHVVGGRAVDRNAALPASPMRCSRYLHVGQSNLPYSTDSASYPMYRNAWGIWEIRVKEHSLSCRSSLAAVLRNDSSCSPRPLTYQPNQRRS